MGGGVSRGQGGGRQGPSVLNSTCQAMRALGGTGAPPSAGTRCLWDSVCGRLGRRGGSGHKREGGG
jgi:hypothetical protein